MKRISQSDLQNMYEPLPQHLSDNVDQILSSLEDREERPIVKKKISVSFVLAAVLIIASMAALAASNMNLFWDMTENRANPILPLEGVEKMIRSDLGSVENEYVTVTVEEAAYDGQSVMTLVRITPKDAEKYALLNAFVQGAREELYESEIRPVKMPTGTEKVEMDGVLYEIINEEDEKAFKIDGKAVDLPNDQETAAEMGYPAYIKDGVMYYADMFEYVVTSRKDGREVIYWWASIDVMVEEDSNANRSAEDPEGTHSENAEEQPDGSVLLWDDYVASEPMSDTVKIKVRSSITVDGQEMKLDDLIFELDRSEVEKKISLVPENGKISDNVEIHSAEISFTKLRGYLTVEYTYVSENEDDMGIFMRLYDADGTRIADGSGEAWEKDENRYVQHMEIQSLAEIPETLILEAKAIDGDAIGRCTCKVITD